MNNFPLLVTTKLNTMDNLQKQMFYKEYNRRRKSLFVAYILLLILGWHYAYLKKWGSQILSIITLWGLLVWWFIDWFRLPSLIKNYNNNIAIEIIKDFVLIYENNQINTTQKNNPSDVELWRKNNPTKSINDYYKDFKK